MSKRWGVAATAVLLVTFVLLGGGLSTIESEAPASGLETVDVSALDQVTVSSESGIEPADGSSPAGGTPAGGGPEETTAAGGDDPIEASVDGELSELDATGAERAALLFGYVANELGILEADIDLDVESAPAASDAELDSESLQDPAITESQESDADSGSDIAFDFDEEAGETSSEAGDDDSTGGTDGPTEEAQSTLSDAFGWITPSMLAGIAAVLLLGYLYVSDRNPVAALLALPAIVSNRIVTALYRLATAFERVVTDLYAVVSISGLWSVLAAWVTDLRKSSRSAVSASESETDRAAPSATGAAESQAQVSAREQIRAAWARLVHVTGVRQYRRQTPAEIRRRALSDGQPGDPVAELTRAFRAVEYGNEDATKHVDNAERAAEALNEPGEPTDDTGSSEDTDRSTGLRNRLFGWGGE